MLATIRQSGFKNLTSNREGYSGPLRYLSTGSAPRMRPSRPAAMMSASCRAHSASRPNVRTFAVRTVELSNLSARINGLFGPRRSGPSRSLAHLLLEATEERDSARRVPCCLVRPDRLSISCSHWSHRGFRLISRQFGAASRRISSWALVSRAIAGVISHSAPARTAAAVRPHAPQSRKTAGRYRPSFRRAREPPVGKRAVG
jgi:hypothetical protein